MKKTIYLDHAATTPLNPLVLKEMLPFLQDNYGNASSPHFKGRLAKQALEKSREIIGNFLGTEGVDIIFTSSATEANNLALKGIAGANKNKGNHIIISSIEHPSVLNVGQFLERCGFKLTLIKVDKYGLVDPNDFKKAITKKTILISCMMVNNEIGTIQPIQEIATLARTYKIYFHSDAVQAVGKLNIEVDDLKIDLLSFSGHKIYGPKGIGALYIKKGVKIMPDLYGGHQERNLRAGTENVASIVGLAKAVQLAKNNISSRIQHLSQLEKLFLEMVKKKINNFYLNGHSTKRIPGLLNLSFLGFDSEDLLNKLNQRGVCLSTAAACSAGAKEPSKVLKAMGLEESRIKSSLRFSFGYENTIEEIISSAKIIAYFVKR